MIPGDTVTPRQNSKSLHSEGNEEGLCLDAGNDIKGDGRSSFTFPLLNMSNV